MQRQRSRLVLLALMASVSFLVAPEPAWGQRGARPYESNVNVPPATDKGSWEGTWFYVSRDARFALWIRPDKRGRPEVKIKYFGMQNSENFTTDWQGRADYSHRNATGTFSLALTERDAKQMKGEWSWLLDRGSSARTENASVTLHRTGDGRRLVVVFDDFDLVIRRGSEVRHVSHRLAYTFAKVSNRLVRWEELPF